MYICTCNHVYIYIFNIFFLDNFEFWAPNSCFQLLLFYKFSVVLRSYAFVVMLADFMRGFCENSTLHKLSTNQWGMSYCHLHNFNHILNVQRTTKSAHMVSYLCLCVFHITGRTGLCAELCYFIILHPHISRLPPPVRQSTAFIVCSTQDLWNRV